MAKGCKREAETGRGSLRSEGIDRPAEHSEKVASPNEGSSRRARSRRSIWYRHAEVSRDWQRGDGQVCISSVEGDRPWLIRVTLSTT